jgi:hypothetical protein
MSNYLAIATVTETLKLLLGTYVSKDVSGATATAVRPSGLNNSGTGNGLPDHGVNIALYQIMPNPAARNLDVPTRRTDGSLVQRPRAAIDLHYLFSVYGTDADLEPHRIMGSVLRTLHTYPSLSRAAIQDAVAGASFLNGTSPSTTTVSDLAQDVELVKLVPLALTLDELSRVWSVYFQTSYTLSVCYQATVVYIEDSATPPASALPVRTPNIVTTPIEAPSIDTLTPQPATAGATLTITGANVGVGGPQIVLGDAQPAPATVVSATQITFTLPPTTPAGVSPLSVARLVNFGSAAAPQLRPGVQSAAVPMALAPTIGTITPSTFAAAAGATLTVNFDTPVPPWQEVALLLGSTVIALPARSPGTLPVKSFAFTVPAGALTASTFVVRLRVGGVESPLTSDPSTGKYIAPAVIVT